MEEYIHLTGRDGMTNYMHFLHAGHFAFYLLRVKNLYKYSQQGWEHLNGKCKRANKHNTAKGGGKNGSSKLLPIVFSFLRELLWRFGYGDRLFKQYENRRMKYGKRVENEDVDNATIDLLATTILNLGSDEDVFGMNNGSDSFNDEEIDDDILDMIKVM